MLQPGGGEHDDPEVSQGVVAGFAVGASDEHDADGPRREQREQDPALEMRTLAEAARVDRFDLQYQESLSKSRRAIELLGRFDDPAVEAAARYEASLVLFVIGDLEEAQRHATAMLAVAERLRDRFWLSSALGLNGTLCQKGGDWQAARDFFERGLAVQAEDSRIEQFTGRASVGGTRTSTPARARSPWTRRQGPRYSQAKARQRKHTR